jgi:hypothetical protein
LAVGRTKEENKLAIIRKSRWVEGLSKECREGGLRVVTSNRSDQMLVVAQGLFDGFSCALHLEGGKEGRHWTGSRGHYDK